MNPPILASIAICIGAAVLEGLCAGTKVRPFLTSLRQPRFGAPFWLWSIIGAVYYAIFGFVVYRVLRLNQTGLKISTLSLAVAMMLANALSNYVLFRARDLRRSFVIGAAFPALDLILFLLTLQLDRLAAMVLLPYLAYRAYGVYWGYAVWKGNPDLQGKRR